MGTGMQSYRTKLSIRIAACAVFLVGVTVHISCSNKRSTNDKVDSSPADLVAETRSAEIRKAVDSSEVSETQPDATSPPADAASFVALIDGDRYWKDLTFIAQVRDPGSPHWQAVQDLCATRFQDLGYTVEIHHFTEMSTSGVNVIGVKEGTLHPEEQVLISAHYDHIKDCEGADDNGSGVAGVLESARVLADATFERTLIVACWDLEESGLVGSRAYATRAKENGDQIIVSLVYEMIGFFSSEPDSQVIPFGFDVFFPDAVADLEANERRGDFIAIISDSLARFPAGNLEHFATNVAGLQAYILELDQSQKNSVIFFDLQRSDHAAFWQLDYPAIMLTDTSNFRNPNYHCEAGPDTIETLDQASAVKVVAATTAAAAQSLVVISID
jgi:hypothetical protein